jgi:hypothetical protein
VISKKSSSLKPLWQMNGNMVGSILERSLIKIANLVLICLINMAATGNSCFWLVDFQKIVSSKAAWPNGSKLGRKNPWKTLYKEWSFISDPFTNMAATGNSYFWLVDF